MNTTEFPKTLFEQVLLYFYKPFLQHINALATKYKNLVRFDDYGTPQYDDWEKELKYFIQTVVLPPLSIKEITAIYNAGFVHSDRNIAQSIYQHVFVKEFNMCTYLPEYQNILESGETDIFFYIVPSDNTQAMSETEMKHALTNKRFEDSFMKSLVANSHVFLLGVFNKNPNLLNQYRTAPLTPLDYEKHIKLELTKLGFDAKTTKGSGDQGADVLASKNGVSFAIQCKKYSKPVGNKAVQEANAGRDFYKQDYGVVVSNAGFTKSARQAAHACGIILLNDNQLEDLLKYTNS